VLQQMLHRRGGDLSGGQQQQLAIARALAAKPKLLVLDEPTEGIQPSIIKDIGRVIRMLADRGDMAILLVEQYYDFAQELADQYLVMERGEVIARGRGQGHGSAGRSTAGRHLRSAPAEAVLPRLALVPGMCADRASLSWKHPT
jgi:ABC-type branched-subunit amino acid transport system ATPase component